MRVSNLYSHIKIYILRVLPSSYSQGHQKRAIHTESIKFLRNPLRIFNVIPRMDGGAVHEYYRIVFRTYFQPNTKMYYTSHIIRLRLRVYDIDFLLNLYFQPSRPWETHHLSEIMHEQFFRELQWWLVYVSSKWSLVCVIM